jgi:hypothetical protein
MINSPASGLKRHRELSHSFALVAPLGGAAVVALHALQQSGAQGPSIAWGTPALPAGMRPRALGPTAYLGENDEQGWAASGCVDRNQREGNDLT